MRACRETFGLSAAEDKRGLRRNVPKVKRWARTTADSRIENQTNTNSITVSNAFLKEAAKQVMTV